MELLALCTAWGRERERGRGREGERGREGGRERERKGGREGGRGREREREGRREGKREEGGREGGRERHHSNKTLCGISMNATAIALQWNLSNPDTNGAEKNVLISEKIHARVILGAGKRVLFTHFRGVMFYYTLMYHYFSSSILRECVCLWFWRCGHMFWRTTLSRARIFSFSELPNTPSMK